MLKNFDEWNKRKKEIDAKGPQRPYFRIGQIWWAHLGENVGVESNGKSEYFLRPVVILRKYNAYSFLAVPLTTSSVKSEFRVPIGMVLGKKAVANVSQLRYLDSKRLLKKISEMEYAPFLELKKKTDEINFHQPFPIDPPSGFPKSGEPDGHNL